MSEAHSNGDAAEFSIIGERTVPETYADSVGFEAGPYGITCVFGKVQQPPSNYRGKPPTVPRVRVHMSPQHFKVRHPAARQAGVHVACFGKSRDTPAPFLHRFP